MSDYQYAVIAETHAGKMTIGVYDTPLEAENRIRTERDVEAKMIPPRRFAGPVMYIERWSERRGSMVKVERYIHPEEAT